MDVHPTMESERSILRPIPINATLTANFAARSVTAAYRSGSRAGSSNGKENTDAPVEDVYNRRGERMLREPLGQEYRTKYYESQEEHPHRIRFGHRS